MEGEESEGLRACSTRVSVLLMQKNRKSEKKDV